MNLTPFFRLPDPRVAISGIGSQVAGDELIARYCGGIHRSPHYATPDMEVTRMTRNLLAVALAGALLLLSACDKSAHPAAGTSSAVATPDAARPSAEATTASKFNAYTEGYNKLVEENWGVRATFNDHRENNIAKANPSDEINFAENVTTLELAISKLKQGRALPATEDEARAADAAVDSLLPPASALLVQWKTFAPYFETRAYRADKLAKYKAADAELTRNYEATLAAVDAFDAALTTHQRSQSVARAEAFKKAGNIPLYHATNTMRLAELFVSAAMAEKTAEADKLLPELETSVAALAAAQQAMAADAPNRTELEQVAHYVGSMLGEYRDFKQSHDASDMKSVVSDYNNAIGDFADIEVPAG